ncbi:MAG: SCO family protein [Alicyclobacillus shizuokensis]|nr:SCO family protein [Alicyclobacillus shizuokensis]
MVSRYGQQPWRRRMRAWTAVLLCSGLAAVGCGSAQGATSMQAGKSDSSQVNLNWQVPHFRDTDEQGQPFSLSDLRGKVWMADFMFTNCTSVCPLTTAHMAKLQRRLRQAGVDAQLVSFTVDPSHDTPQRLRTYAAKYRADLTNWHFLTGYSSQSITRFARDGFKAVIESIPKSNQYTHSTEFYLVGPDGKVVHVYDGLHPNYAKIVAAVRSLET